MKIYLGGRWVDPSESLVPVLNSACLFGETLYEAVPVYKGAPLFLDDHLERLGKGCRFLGWKTPSRKDIKRILEGFRKRWGKAENFIVRFGLIQDLGSSPGPRTFSRSAPLLFANARPLRHDPQEATPRRGKVGIGKWKIPSASAYPYGFKTTFFLTARRDIEGHPEWEEMLRLSEGGKVLDGFSSSPLLFRGREVLSGGKEGGLISVTKKRILGLCKKKGLRILHKPWHPQQAYAPGMELVFVGSGVGILSPSHLNGRSLGPIGPWTSWLWDCFRRWVEDLPGKRL